MTWSPSNELADRFQPVVDGTEDRTVRFRHFPMAAEASLYL